MIKKQTYFLLFFAVLNHQVVYGSEMTHSQKWELQKERYEFAQKMQGTNVETLERSQEYGTYDAETLRETLKIDGIDNMLLYVAPKSHNNSYQQTIIRGVQNIYIYISERSHDNQVVLDDAFNLTLNQPRIDCTIGGRSYNNTIYIYSWNEWDYNATVSGDDNQIVVLHPWRKYTHWFGAAAVAAAVYFYFLK